MWLLSCMDVMVVLLVCNCCSQCTLQPKTNFSLWDNKVDLILSSIRCLLWTQPSRPALVFPEGISGCMESLLRCYSGQLPATRQQRPNASVDLNVGYGHDVPLQQSLTPPQMPGDHMYPYGEEQNPFLIGSNTFWKTWCLLLWCIVHGYHDHGISSSQRCVTG